ncbi:MAG: hypothetical protein ACREEW_03195 [Caulobacteraceae bacterium]
MIHQIGWHDLQFPHRIPVRFFSTAGVPQIRWEPVGVPHIPQKVVDGTFFLFASVEDARTGTNPGGSGFVVRYDGPPAPGYYRGRRPTDHFYAVTNWHVAVAGGFSVIRLNTADGSVDIIDLGPEDWQFLPGMYDVCATPITIRGDLHKVSSISTLTFCADPSIPHNTGYKIGVGEDVFMIGLFVDHAGVGTNAPAARFGNISMLPNRSATLRQSTGYESVNYIVDMHSRSGFSGSPVYVYRTIGNDLSGNYVDAEVELRNVRIDTQLDKFSGKLRANNLFMLLGIHWGQFPEAWEIKSGRPRSSAEAHLLEADDRYVRGMSGMTCVIPAWHILEVLEMPKLKGPRDAATRQDDGSSDPIPENATP